MATLKTSILFQIQAILTATAPAQGGPEALQRFVDDWNNGTGAGQADVVHFRDYEITAGGSTDIDLAGTLKDMLGTTASFAKVKAIFSREITGDNSVHLGPKATNGWGHASAGGFVKDVSDRRPVPPDGMDAWVNPAGLAVTGGTGDILAAEAPAGTNPTLRILIIGTSA